MGKLPKVYQNSFHKKIRNNKEVCYLEEEKDNALSHTSTRGISSDVESILDEIFSGVGYAYNIPIILTTTSRVYETSLVAKTKNNVITLDNDIIPISDIVKIEMIS